MIRYNAVCIAVDVFEGGGCTVCTEREASGGGREVRDTTTELGGARTRGPEHHKISSTPALLELRASGEIRIAAL